MRSSSLTEAPYLKGFGMSIKLLTSGDLDLLSVVLYTFRCSFSRIFEVIGGLVQGLGGLFLCGGTVLCLMH